ncbi:protein transport protein Sec16A [Protopterus annectens]|uniref:protein transport protein Sec16A n=1 Tax=Protopterus annectens TaxID=7888 RepID=UPI001CF978AE|nr:protein transport protein Sec16A [Protopterus annectens]
MQPPPQTVPLAAGGPPPGVGTPNMFRRKNPYQRQGNVPASGIATSVQPVTDPFALGKQTSQNASGSPNAQGLPPPGFSQHAAVPAHDSNAHGLHGPFPGPPNVVQPLVSSSVACSTPASSLAYSGSSSFIPASSGTEPGSHTGFFPSGTSQRSPHVATDINKEQPNVTSYVPPTSSHFLPHNVNMPSSYFGPAQIIRPPSSSGSFSASLGTESGIHNFPVPSVAFQSVNPPQNIPPSGRSVKKEQPSIPNYLHTASSQFPPQNLRMPVDPTKSPQNYQPCSSNSSFPAANVTKPPPTPSGATKSSNPIQNRPHSGIGMTRDQTVHSYVQNDYSLFPQQNLNVQLGNLGNTQDGQPHPVHSLSQVTEAHVQNMNSIALQTTTCASTGLQFSSQQVSAQPVFQNVHQPNKQFDASLQSKQGVGIKGEWFNYPSEERNFPQQQLQNSSILNLVTQPVTYDNSLQLGSETLNGSHSMECHTGTVAMFFKGDEVENEEILSSERNDCSNSAVETFNQSPEQFYNSTAYPRQGASDAVSQLSAGMHFGLESTQVGGGCQNELLSNVADQRTTQVNSVVDGCSNDDSEFNQNQEVPPSETSNVHLESQHARPENSSSVLQDNAEVGPNLETPDFISHPLRSDSVSSNYSNLSHRSVSSLKRHKELPGTFIQQESEKPSEGVSDRFFQQIDDQLENSSRKAYLGNLSQPATPSPPKPTGIFQTSANSSFEPVRSHGIGVKPVEVDQAKMVMELNREDYSVPSNTVQKVNATDVSPGNLEQPPDNVETIHTHSHALVSAAVSDIARPSSRSHSARMKCESPLWAQNELPNITRSIVLAPAAPSVHVPAKHSNTDIIQPPEEGSFSQQVCSLAPLPLLTAKDGNTSSENLENPPKIEAKPQVGSGYATLLVTSPTESLQNQPVLLALPPQSLSVSQQINTCVSASPASNQSEIYVLSQDQGAKANLGTLNQASFDNIAVGGSTASTIQARPLASTDGSTHLLNAHLMQTNFTPVSVTSSLPASLQPFSNHMPLNLAPESRQNMKLESCFSVSSSKSPGQPPNIAAGARDIPVRPQAEDLNIPSKPTNESAFGPQLIGGSSNVLADFAVLSIPENPTTNNLKFSSYSAQSDLTGVPQMPVGIQTLQQEAQKSDRGVFFQQVTKDAQQSFASSVTQGAMPQPNMHLSTQQPVATQSYTNLPSQLHYPLTAANGYVQTTDQPKVPVMSSHFTAEHGLQKDGCQSSNGTISVGATSSQPVAIAPHGNTAQQSSNQDQQRPSQSQTPQQLSGPPAPGSGYGYYGQSYSETGDGRPPYQVPYPQPDPRAARYHQTDAYKMYDPRYGWYDNYRTYREPERYQYPEPERPSSRTSQHSDRPSSRQGIAEDGYQRSGQSAYEDNYADYYRNQYNYGDPSRWDRYDPAAYDSRYRDYRAYSQAYWYGYDWQAYRRDPYYRDPYSMSRQGYEDHWRYDPRYDASFDDEYDRRRDPYGGEEFDRRSVHSEHSAHSVHSSRSRRSSFSSRSQQSQVYRSQSQQDLAAGAYDIPDGSGSLNVEYSYEQYQENINGEQSLSDYQYGYTAPTVWQMEDQVPPRPVTPEKFTVPHVCAKFGPGGQLLKVLPNLPSEGQPTLVEIHNMETMLQHLPEQEELRSFHGPLVKEETHKADVITFAQKKATECLHNESLIDKESAKLLWDVVILLCRQNGTVVGTDVAELLLKEHKSVWLPGKSPNEANLIDFSNEPLEHAEEESGASQLSFLTDSLLMTSDNANKEMERFRELLLFGRKKDALEAAMKHGMWGHALLLASKMDSRTHARVMTRFANSLPINDPLQTVYQLMSGRMPAASTCCGDEKWGDWRPHLAMILSNLTNSFELDTRTIITMGDTLASKGLVDAAHFCYLMAQVGFGVFTKKATKLVLIGSNHSLPFLKFATNGAIQRTETYEYAQSLGNQPSSIPSFQVYKLIYACRLADMGLSSQAFHYCEVISRTVLNHPSCYSPFFVSQLIEVSARLCFFDPVLKEKPEGELHIEPEWLLHLRQLDGQIKEGVISYISDRATPNQYSSSTPSSELDQNSQYDGTAMPNEMGLGVDNALTTTLQPIQGPAVTGVQLMPPAPLTVPGGTAMGSLPPQQPYDNSVSFPPVGPPYVSPVPTLTPPASGSFPGFGMPYEPVQTPIYTTPSVQAVGSPVHMMPTLPEQPFNKEPGPSESSQNSPTRQSFPEHGRKDFYDKMAEIQGGRRSRTTSQSSTHLSHGRRSRTTSESSTHSAGRERRNSAAKQSSPPPIQEVPPNKAAKPEKGPASNKGTGFGIFRWLTRRATTEAHLPDDRNKSIVWDEKKQRWIDINEPEEESKPPPPPPTSFPKIPQPVSSGPGSLPGSGAPPVNVYSRRAGNRGRYVDILNPGTKPNSSVPAPCDLFAPLAPMSIPTFVPSAVPEDQQPLESTGAEVAPSPSQPSSDASTGPQLSNPASLPSSSEVLDGTESGELSRSSSMSSLSREVSQHLSQVPSDPPPPLGPPSGVVQFYNPAQFAQPSAPTGNSRLGRFGQRKYPSMK